MQIDHIALCVRDLEAMRDFYIAHFGAVAGELYHNPRTGLRTYFLTFDGGARMELMQRPDARRRRAARGLGAPVLCLGEQRGRGRGNRTFAKCRLHGGKRPARDGRRLLRKLCARSGGQPRRADGLKLQFSHILIDRATRPQL